MENKFLVWGFSDLHSTLYSKNVYNGNQNSRIFVNLPTVNGIIDMIVVFPKAYFLQNSSLWAFSILTEKLKKYDLKLGSYAGILHFGKELLILGKNSLKFDSKSKLCRKIDLPIRRK